MIGRNHAGQKITDMIVVIIRGSHQRFKVFEEQFLIERDRRADVDQFVIGLFQSFCGHQLFFIQLLAGTQTGILDLNVHIRLQSRLFDQVSGKRIDFDRTAHVEHEDLSALGIGPGKHDALQ